MFITMFLVTFTLSFVAGAALAIYCDGKSDLVLKLQNRISKLEEDYTEVMEMQVKLNELMTEINDSLRAGQEEVVEEEASDSEAEEDEETESESEEEDEYEETPRPSLKRRRTNTQVDIQEISTKDDIDNLVKKLHGIAMSIQSEKKANENEGTYLLISVIVTLVLMLTGAISWAYIMSQGPAHLRGVAI